MVWDSKPGRVTPEVEVDTEVRKREPHLNKNAACLGPGYYFSVLTELSVPGEDHCATATGTMGTCEALSSETLTLWTRKQAGT